MEKAITGAGPTSEVFAGREDEVARATADTRAAVRRVMLELAPDVVPEAAPEAGIAVTCWARSFGPQKSADTILIRNLWIKKQIYSKALGAV